MPRQRPPTSGYARLSQAEEEDANHYFDNDDDDPTTPVPRTPRTISTSAPQYAPIQPGQQGSMQVPAEVSSPGSRRGGRPRRRPRRNSSGVDIKAINARLERWADEIASKFKIHKVKGKSHEEEKLEIHHTVFQAPEGVVPATAESLQADPTDKLDKRITKMEFDDIVESVRTAIELGVHPLMISQGSSGSYFARNTDGKTVGVFKPKDEEPYASRNPKWTKWIHRNLFPCFFGRACLIPNLSYVSEAAAYVLDSRLRTNLVPYTDVVHLSSKAFFYDFWQRSAFYRKRKPLPDKPGSFQVFLKGFKDANIFLRDHPWPDQINTGFRIEDAPNRRKRPWDENCRPSGAHSDDDEDAMAESRRLTSSEETARPGRFHWSEALQQSFREELEKLVILDYIMRNTDRGLDNWMVKVDHESQQVSIVSEPVRLNGGESSAEAHPVPVGQDRNSLQDPYKRQEAMSRSGLPGGPKTAAVPKISLGAIDNSLSWPWKHPDAWRSFPFGWLFLPVSLIGQPFSQKTRDHFLPLLTSTAWWSDTQVALRRIFEQDSDFKERMFARQIAVMKGQAWNVVETLKTPDHGPLELTRRTRVCVWDDLVDIPVAIPLRTPSAEMRRNREGRFGLPGGEEEEDEMDISAANGSVSQPPKLGNDLMRFSPPPSELPNPNRFELSRNLSTADIGTGYDDPEMPSTVHGEPLYHSMDSKDFAKAESTRPNARRSMTRASYEGHRRRASSGAGHGRHHSYSTRYDNSFMYDGDDADGDLGYVAARVTEKHTRKVIVERLETVKSRNPVFTWC